jgi:hypothetical protein
MRGGGQAQGAEVVQLMWIGVEKWETGVEG